MQKAMEMINIAMKNGSNFFEWTHKRINGEDFPATVLLTRVTIGGKTFLQATVRDITERKKAEEHLRNIKDGIFTLDTDGRFTFVNSVVEKRSGIPAEKCVGTHFLDIVHSDYHDIVKENFQKIMNNEEVLPYSLGYKKADGGILMVEIDTNPIVRDGKVVGLHGASRDIEKK